MGFQDSVQRIFDDLYGTFGVDLAFASPRDGSEVTLRAIDRTAGVELIDNKTMLGTIRPVAALRAASLAGLGLLASDMIGVIVTLSGASWRVKATEPKPGPYGESSGEVYLVLTKRDDG